MALALLKEEREVVEAVLWFANLKKVESTVQIEKRFGSLKLVPGVFQIIPGSDIEAYKADQAQLRQWLGYMIEGKDARKSFETILSQRLSGTIFTQLGFQDGRLFYRYGLTGVQAACAFGLAIILDRERKLESRLKQCGSFCCGKFNLDFEPKGRPRRFCNTECKRLSDNQDAAARVRRHRIRMDQYR